MASENNVIQPRPYHDPSDLIAMRQLLADGTKAGIAAAYMHPGALDWGLHYPPDEAANQRDLVLWPHGSAPTLLAWAIHLRHEGTFDLFVHPSIYGTPIHATIMDQYVLWATVRARQLGLTQLAPFWALEQDTAADRMLQARGFQRLVVDPAPPLFERSLSDLPDEQLPAGWTVRGVRDLADGEQRARVTHAAFRPDADWTCYWAEYAQFIGSAVYRGERDLVVLTPDGRGAAACTIWFDEVNRVGLFEPVATHPEFQRRGLGKAVLAEGMRRMRAAGMERAILGFDPNNAPARALYSALGFQAIAYFAVYQKPLGAAQV